MKRISWVDNIKFYAILCVILGHSFSTIKGGFRSYDDINLFIVAFNMPLFAFISGITSNKGLFRISSFKEMINYLNKIAWHIGVPTVIYTLLAMAVSYGMQLRWSRSLISFILLAIVCLFIYSLHSSIYSNRLKKLVQYFPYIVIPICLINQSVWYFVFVLMSLFCAAPSAYIAKKTGHCRLISFSLSFAVFSYAISMWSPFASTLEFYLPFIVGILYYERRGYDVVFSKKPHSIIGALLLLSVGILLFTQYYSINNQFYLLDFNKAITDHQCATLFFRQATALILILSFTLIIQILSGKYNKASLIGSMTFGIYPIHAEIIGIYKTYISPLSLNSVFLRIIFVIVLASILLVISIYTIKFIRRSKYLKLILLGE